ncbi:VIR-like CYIR protein [Plasmodium cynomolgi strain B]|uniref:VIR-like CYIR protein n=1 Tax=Plasmodium cynomolgi (strain B) TaxID=1120755 RepID=K6V6Z7_PLACD|nr:VIR-like CYIR protein [Plasmodium cynomolgi strain B]GAB64892.1 VIR-like CYIR protein [Plasmodium cynomolgi strain B]
MSLYSIDFLNFKYNEDNKFEKLYSQKIHKALKKDVINADYDQYCPDINLHETEKNVVKNLCKNIIFNLNELLNVKDIGENNRERFLNVKY